MDDYLERMHAAGRDICVIRRIVEDAARVYTDVSLYNILASYGYCYMQLPGVRLGVNDFLEIVIDNFPLDDESLWCTDITAGPPSAQREDRLLRSRTCATFLLGGFKVFINDSPSYAVSFASGRYRYTFDLFAKRASDAVFVRTLVVICASDLPEALGDRLSEIIRILMRRVKRYISSIAPMTIIDAQEIFECLRNSRIVGASLLKMPEMQILANSPSAIQHVIYECSKGTNGKNRTTWADRGEEVFQTHQLDTRLLLTKIYDSSTLHHAGDYNESFECDECNTIFSRVCTWLTPSQRTMVHADLTKYMSSSVDSKHTRYAIHIACIQACTVPTKSAHDS